MARPRLSPILPAIVTAALTVAGLLAGCGDSPSPAAPSPDATAAAIALCRPIRDWVNELAELANRTAAETGELDDPEARAQRILAGYDELAAATGRYQDDLSDLTIAGTDDGPRAADDLRAGADRARGVLEDEREEFASETGGAVTDGDLVGRMGQFMISLETTTGSAEPPVVRYTDDAFRRAVLDEPTCDQVVQPFDL